MGPRSGERSMRIEQAQNTQEESKYLESRLFKKKKKDLDYLGDLMEVLTDKYFTLAHRQQPVNTY